MARVLPVPEVTDLGPASIEKLRSAGFDMGPGNLNVPKPGSSAKAQAFRAGAAPPPASPPPSMRDRISKGVRDVRGTATSGARVAGTALLPAGLGAAVGAAQRRADLAAEPEPFTPAAAKPGDIPSDPSMRGPAAVPMRRPLGIGPNDDFTRNAANTLLALSGGRAFVAAPAAAAVPQTLKGTGAVFNTAAPLAAAGNAGRIRAGADATLRGTQGFVAGAQGGVALTDAAVQPTAAPSPELPQSPTLSRGTASTELDNPNGVITRDGNSYSGTDVKAGADIVNPDGSMRTPGGTVTNLQTLGFDGYMKQLNAIRSLGAAPSFSENGAPSPTPGMSGIRSGPQDPGLEVDTRGMSARQAASAKLAAATLAQEREIAAMRDGTARAGTDQALAIAQMNNETSRANNEASTSAMLRGQELTAQSAARAAQRQAAIDERNFRAGRADKAMEQRGAREKEFAAKVDRMFTVDGEVDAPRAARFQEGIDRAVARLSSENPNIKSIADLQSEDEQQLVAATTLLERVREQGSLFNPFQVRKIKTMDPLDLVGLQVDPESGDRIVTRGKPISEGGSRGFVIPRRFFETEEANFFMPGTKTNRFDPLDLPSTPSIRDNQ